MSVSETTERDVFLMKSSAAKIMQDQKEFSRILALKNRI